VTEANTVMALAGRREPRREAPTAVGGGAA
jgi:hypothetical protein